MSRFFFCLLAGMALSLAPSLYAESETKPPEETPTDLLALRKTQLELGGTVGFPLGLGVQFGVWNIGGSPLFARVAPGFFVLGASLEGEIGYLFDPVGDFKQYLSIAGGGFNFVIPLFPILLTSGSGFYVGPQYGMILWKFLSVSVGAAFGSSSSSGAFFLIPTSGSDSGVVPFGKISASWFF